MTRTIPYTRSERFAEFLRRLGEASPVSSSEAALNIIAVTLNAVEDEMTTIRFDPGAWQTDGRMYPPQPDARREVPGNPEVLRYRSRAHNTYIRCNGAFEIRTMAGEVLISRFGLDGQGVWG